MPAVGGLHIPVLVQLLMLARAAALLLPCTAARRESFVKRTAGHLLLGAAMVDDHIGHRFDGVLVQRCYALPQVGFVAVGRAEAAVVLQHGCRT